MKFKEFVQTFRDRLTCTVDVVSNFYSPAAQTDLCWISRPNPSWLSRVASATYKLEIPQGELNFDPESDEPDSVDRVINAFVNFFNHHNSVKFVQTIGLHDRPIGAYLETVTINNLIVSRIKYYDSAADSMVFIYYVSFLTN
jgi:hypothetical protein